MRKADGRILLGVALVIILCGCSRNRAETPYGDAESLMAYRAAVDPIISEINEVEESLRGMPNTLTRALQALHNCNENGIDININSVINKQNADHLDENIEYFIEHHPYIRHFVWNNLDPSMGRAETNLDSYMHRLRDS